MIGRQGGIGLVAALLLGGCTLAAGAGPPVGQPAMPPTSSPLATSALAITASSATPPAATPSGLSRSATNEAFPPEPGPPPVGTRLVHEQAWTPFAAAGGIVLHHPSSRVERIGYHESNTGGARELITLPSAIAPTTLSSRERGTDSATAADVVVDPAIEIRSPVSGRVVRAGGYTLYCRYNDHFVVVEPDDHPGWEVKILHLAAANVRVGQRVEAGVTVLAPGPNRFPFVSQVDAVTASPSWPHVHVEIDDPTIPDLPGAGGC
jgi:murein DD-endopeptidase MepM/ murein hydrolase activator NlpD